VAAIKYTALPVATLANGTHLTLPLIEIAGTQPGPTVGICGSIHGDEHTGVEVIYRFVQGFDASQLKGRILIMPVANPMGFEAFSRNTPLDMLDINRQFPGDKDGWLTQQMAYVVTQEFLKKVDYLLDFHGGGLLQTVDYVYILNHEEMSRNFGSKLLYRPDPSLQGTVYAGTSSSIAQDFGVKAMTIELGGGLIDQGEYVKRGVAGIYNVLRTLGAVPGAPAPRPKQIVMHEIKIMRTHQGGILVPEFTGMNEIVTGGQVLGRVVSPHNFEVLETMVCPFERGITVLLHQNVTKTQPGDYAYMIGNLANAELPE
jgi:predicted deacylase